MKEFETKEGTRYHFDFAYVNDFGNYTIDIYIQIDDIECISGGTFNAGNILIEKEKVEKYAKRFPQDEKKALVAYFKTIKGYEKIKSIDDFAYLEVSRLATENGWKGIDEFVERKVYPFHYAQAKQDAEWKLNDYFIESILYPLKQLEEKIKSVKIERRLRLYKYDKNLNVIIGTAEEGKSIDELPSDKVIEVQKLIKNELENEGYITFDYISNNCTEMMPSEENALMRLFYALADTDKKRSNEFFRRLKESWNNEYDYRPCRECVIYHMAFPDDKYLFLRQGGGFKKPIKLKVREIKEYFLDKYKYFIERQAIQQICKNMHIERDTTTGRPKKTI